MFCVQYHAWKLAYDLCGRMQLPETSYVSKARVKNSPCDGACVASQAPDALRTRRRHTCHVTVLANGLSRSVPRFFLHVHRIVLAGSVDAIQRCDGTQAMQVWMRPQTAHDPDRRDP